jgi:hypothetical protein
MFAGFARMRVWNSGGPIHAPHDRVLQLLISPWDGGEESWTLYRHEAGAHKDGKIVFKKWNSEMDKRRFRALGRKPAPKDWRNKVSVIEKQFQVFGQWVKALERKIETLSVPPIAGAVRPLAHETVYTLSFWRSHQRAEFSWNSTAPAAWRPIAKLFFSLLRAFRRHADGKPIVPVDEL